MIAQMADRCYLEKCRDRLYAEFVLGGVALPIGANGGRASANTPRAWTCCARRRSSCSTCAPSASTASSTAPIATSKCCSAAAIPYIESIDRNLEYLQQILRSENWRLLRRNPPVFAAVPDSMATTRTLMLGYIKKVWG